MGKKSKRRGVNAGKKSAVGTTCSNGRCGGEETDIVADTLALLQVPAPASFAGVISTNADPNRCACCMEEPIVSEKLFLTFCCGKLICSDNCPKLPNCSCSAVDLVGKKRCVFCNARTSSGKTILENEANLGKPWAQHLLASELARDGLQKEAFMWWQRAAKRGHPYAFLVLSRKYLSGDGVLRDLKLSELCAKKARSLCGDVALTANATLVRIAAAHGKAGQADEAKAVLLDVAKEVDETGLDVQSCVQVASVLSRYRENRSSGDMFAKSFFWFGRIESATCAAIMFSRCGEVALSKLWLDVARRTNLLDEECLWSLNESACNQLAAYLRNIRDLCSGCRATLEGDARKMCRCCRTYCYCNEECQERHWIDGHREECKQVEAHMINIQAAIWSGKFDRFVGVSYEIAEKKLAAKLCSGCGKKSDTLEKCTACECAWYCNSDCQERHRGEHEKECQRIKEELGKRGGKLDVGTELDIGPLGNVPMREKCLICKRVVPILPMLSEYWFCCGKTICCCCLLQDNIRVTKVNAERAQRGQPPLSHACPLCRTALPQSDEELTARLSTANHKDPKAGFEIAKLYRRGDLGHPVDQAQCIRLFRESSDRGCPAAQYELAKFHRDGMMGLEQNEEEYLRYLEQAAEGGDVFALYQLGVEEFTRFIRLREERYRIDMGEESMVEADEMFVEGEDALAAAMRHWRLSASTGYAPPMESLISRFENGLLRHSDLAVTLQVMYRSRVEMGSEHRDEYIKLLKETGRYHENYDM